MKDNFQLRDSFGLQIAKKLPIDTLDLKGIFEVEHWRSGKLIDKFSFTNGITNAGKNYLLNCGFVSGTQVLTANWRMSLIDQSGFVALSATDIMSSKGWSEFTGYTQPSRPAWGPATSTAQLLTNPTLCQFDIGVTGVVMGGFIVSYPTINDVSNGILWTSGQFPGPTNVTASVDQLRLIYNLAS